MSDTVKTSRFEAKMGIALRSKDGRYLRYSFPCSPSTVSSRPSIIFKYPGAQAVDLYVAQH
jgi:hypothetical protein